MGVLGAAVYIVLIAVIGGIIILRMIFQMALRSKELKAQSMARDAVTSDQMAQLLEQMDRLEQRMRVLERIATDKSERLQRELSELED